MKTMNFLSLFVLTLTLGGVVLGGELRITSVNDFTQFMNNVNRGSSTYLGTTVFLDTDLSLSGVSISPIGTSSSSQFLGTFDGQGHIISDLKIVSYSQYVGLFGGSSGMTARNIVLDSSCSITSSITGSSSAYIGGIIGYYSGNNQCTIESVVNIAKITFSGSITGLISFYIGGIIGYLSSSSYNNIVKNCVNYGSVVHSGSSYGSYVGGIAGGIESNSVLQNCANYGNITHEGSTSSTLRLGGIVGYSAYARMENCLSAGRISIKRSANDNYIGSLIGNVGSYTYATYCYFTGETGTIKLYGNGHPSNMTGTPTSASVADSTLVSNLNGQVTTENGFNQWVFNINFTVSLNKNNAHWLSSQLKVILLLSLSTGGDYAQHNFVGWFTDDLFASPFTANSISESTTLYGLYGTIIVVTFDPLGGTVTPSSKMTSFNSFYGRFPTPTKEGFTFLGWFTENNEEVTPESIVSIPNDHTLHAQWTAIKYTISFESNGESECPDITQDYGTPLTLPEPNRTGYTFVHWCSDPSLSTEYTRTTMPGENTTLYGKWTPNTYIVTFNANGGIETLQSFRVTFGSFYEEIFVLPTPTNEGFIFVGWFTENNESVTSESIVAIPNDHTLYAHWEEIPSNQVEIIFWTNDLNKNEAKNIINKYTDDEFKIIRFENGDESELRVIIEFKDIEKAESFVEVVRGSSEVSAIRKVSFILDKIGSFSVRFNPFLFLSIF